MSWLTDLKQRLSDGNTAGELKIVCPRCEVKLHEVEMGPTSKVMLDVCPKCHGLWLDSGELDRLDQSPWANIEELMYYPVDEKRNPVSCPKCAVDLDPVSPADFSDVVVDRCANCSGFWLDNGELERMQDVTKDVDAKQTAPFGDEKPAGWSDLRWRFYLLKKNRD